MNAITLWEPWATWIRLGYKTIETRGHSRQKSLVGQRIAIHAGMHYDEEAKVIAAEYWPPDLGTRDLMLRGSPGHIVATALVVEARWLRESDSQSALCPTDGDRFGLFLCDVVAVPLGHVVKGRQGIWPLPSELAAAVEKSMLGLESAVL